LAYLPAVAYIFQVGIELLSRYVAQLVLQISPFLRLELLVDPRLAASLLLVFGIRLKLLCLVRIAALAPLIGVLILPVPCEALRRLRS
jgi:hypothetical protein